VAGVKSRIAFLLSSALSWALVLILAVFAIGAPCGLAPGEWCDTEGPNWFGAVLGMLGPFGVLALASVIYGGALWLSYRGRVKR